MTRNRKVITIINFSDDTNLRLDLLLNDNIHILKQQIKKLRNYNVYTKLSLKFMDRKIRLNYTTINNLVNLQQKFCNIDSSNSPIQNSELVSNPYLISIDCEVNSYYSTIKPTECINCEDAERIIECTCTNPEHYLYQSKSEVVFLCSINRCGSLCDYCNDRYSSEQGIIIPAALHFNYKTDIDKLTFKVPKYLDEIPEDKWIKFIKYLKKLSSKIKKYDVSYGKYREINAKNYEELNKYEKKVLEYKKINLFDYTNKDIEDI